MVSQPNLKRVSCVISLMSAAVVVVIALVAHNGSGNAISEGKFPAPKNEQCISSSSSAARNDHPKPWLKIVVSHIISVATRLAI
jgi:hypothetical protein